MATRMSVMQLVQEVRGMGAIWASEFPVHVGHIRHLNLGIPTGRPRKMNKSWIRILDKNPPQIPESVFIHHQSL